MRGVNLIKHETGLTKSSHGTINISKYATYKDTAIVTEGTGIITIGNSVLEDCRILAEDEAKVYIGDDCILRGLTIVCCEKSNVAMMNQCTVHADFWGRTTIHSMNGASVFIANDCMLSGNIVIRNNDGHDIHDINNVVKNLAQDIRLGEHVWICEGARILKGVNIGKNSIVGCGSVVTNNTYRSNSKIAGNPAHIIGDLTNNTWTHDAIINRKEN